MSQVRIISICQRTINVINYAQQCASLITKQVEKSKGMRIVSTSMMYKQNGFRVFRKLYLNLCLSK